MHRLTDLHRPFIACVLTDRTPIDAIATMRLAALEGADAYEANLPALGTSSPRELESIFKSLPHPIYTSCRRAPFMAVYGMDPAGLPQWSDVERMERQLAALRLGATGIDMEMDTFDPHPAPVLDSDEEASFAEGSGDPAEVTYDASAVARQQEVIDRAHELGGEVILSCHTGRPQDTATLVHTVETAIARGADLVKVVSPCPRQDDLFALFAATAKLTTDVSTPFALVGAGENGALSRIIGCAFGSGWAIAQRTYQPGGFHGQPLVRTMRDIFRLIPSRYIVGT